MDVTWWVLAIFKKNKSPAVSAELSELIIPVCDKYFR